MYKRFQRPSMPLLATELPRSLCELAAFVQSIPLLKMLPRGDGHTVLVLPGFTGDDPSTMLLRWFLDDRGYRSAPWKLGRNLGPTDEILDGMDLLVEELTRDGEQISIVGWSLGGIFARELGRQYPNRVRQVITLGSPFRLTAEEREETNASTVFEAVSALHSERVLESPGDDFRPPMPLPVTNIYTQGDGVAPWQSCIDARGARCENVEVLGSHCGLGHNPLVLAVVAERLAQPLGTWEPYVPPRCLGGAVKLGPVPDRLDEMAAA